MSSENAIAVDLVACGDPRHLADLVTLRERGLAVPHHYSSWALRELTPGASWCRVTDPAGTLITGFTIELLPSRVLPGTRIGRVDRLGRALHAAALPQLGAILRAAAERVPRLLRLDVRVFDESETRRRELSLALMQAGATQVGDERDYTRTLILPISNLEETFADSFSRRMRLEVTRFIEHPGARIAPISDPRYVERIRALHGDSFARTGESPPALEIAAMMRDAAGGESLLLGAFCSEVQAPDDLVAYAWARSHGDHVVYESGGSQRAPFLQHLSPGYALLWSIAHWGRGRGATWLDLGGVTAQGSATYNALAGVEAFKRRFSKDETTVAAEFSLQPSSALATFAGRLRRVGRVRAAPRTMKNDMQHKVIESDADFAALEPQWNRLLAQSPHDLLPLTHFWTRIWWKHFGGNARRQVHCFYQDDRLVAVAPMLLATTAYRGMKLRQLTSMANGHTPHSGLLHARDLDGAQISAIAREIVRTSGADITGFLRVPEADELCMRVRNQRSFDGHPLGLRRSVATPLIRINSDWETFFGSRSQKFRKNMRNKANKYARAPGHRIERRIVTSPDDPVFDQLQEVSRHSWKGKVGTDLASVPAARAFLHDLVGAIGQQDGVHIWMGYAGEQPIAFEFHARYAGVTYPLRADFDERHRDVSPGSVVEYTALKETFEEGAMKLYDSCANDYWYLSNWTEEVRVHYDIEVFGRGLKPRLAHLAEFHLVPMARRWREKLRGKDQADPARPASSH